MFLLCFFALFGWFWLAFLLSEGFVFSGKYSLSTDLRPVHSKYFPEKIKVPPKSTPSWQLFTLSLKGDNPKDSHPSGGLAGTPHSDICYPSGGLWGYSLLGGWPIFSKRPNTHYHFLMLSPFISTTSFMRLAIEPTRFCGATYPLTALMHFFWKSSKLSSSCSICLNRFSAFGQTFSCGLRSGLCHVSHNYLSFFCLA